MSISPRQSREYAHFTITELRNESYVNMDDLIKVFTLAKFTKFLKKAIRNKINLHTTNGLIQIYMIQFEKYGKNSVKILNQTILISFWHETDVILLKENTIPNKIAKKKFKSFYNNCEHKLSNNVLKKRGV